jgi:wobble nucleotide-excising tRNase
MFKRNWAREIAGELNLGRRYIATNLDQDMETLDLDCSMLLDDDDSVSKRTLFHSESGGELIEEVSLPPVAIGDYLRRVRDHCESTFSGTVLEALKDHAEMLKWVSDGLHFHKSHGLSVCLFCDNSISEGRLCVLEKSIDERFTKLIDTTKSLQSEGEALLDKLGHWWGKVAPAAAVDLEWRPRYELVRCDQETAKEDLQSYVIAAREPLQAKAGTPNLAVVIGIDLESIEKVVALALQAREFANILIGAHNHKVQCYDQEKTDAFKALKLHRLTMIASDYNLCADKLDVASHEAVIREELQQVLASRVEGIKKRLRQHGLAVEPINRLLAAYLGHGDVTLAASEDGYQIERGGHAIDGPLSEGEKTAVAICYFISKLQENGRQLRDLIVVIDDPISSLDTKALNYAFTLLRASIEGAKQVFILMHNMQFMNEVKKWLKSRIRRDDEPTAAMYFLDVRLSSDNVRCTTMRVLPKLLRDYDSEYHYLFSVVIGFVHRTDDNVNLGYGLPNIMRKIIELFLSFKVPGADGLESKLKHPIVRDCGLDQPKISALARLAQVESHGDNLDDLVSFSSMTIEEVETAAKALCELVQRLDEQHFNMMKRICS